MPSRRPESVAEVVEHFSFQAPVADLSCERNGLAMVIDGCLMLSKTHVNDAEAVKRGCFTSAVPAFAANAQSLLKHIQGIGIATKTLISYPKVIQCPKARVIAHLLCDIKCLFEVIHGLVVAPEGNTQDADVIVCSPLAGTVTRFSVEDKSCLEMLQSFRIAPLAPVDTGKIIEGVGFTRMVAKFAAETECPIEVTVRFLIEPKLPIHRAKIV